MTLYLVKLLVLLPLLGALIWGSLKLAQMLQNRLAHGGASEGDVELLSARMVAPGLKLAVLRFHDREILLAASRQGLVPLSEVRITPLQERRDDNPVARAAPDRGAHE